MISVTTFSQDCPVTRAPVASSGGFGLEDSPEALSVNAGLVATGTSAGFPAGFAGFIALAGAGVGAGAEAGAGVGPRATAHAAADVSAGLQLVLVL